VRQALMLMLRCWEPLHGLALSGPCKLGVCLDSGDSSTWDVELHCLNYTSKHISVQKSPIQKYQSSKTHKHPEVSSTRPMRSQKDIAEKRCWHRPGNSAEFNTYWF
jgi:hypothetical protein